MVVAAARVTLYLGEGRSLKEKRRFLQSLTGRLRASHEASLSEVEAHDLLQKAVLGVCLAAPDVDSASARLARLLADLEAFSGLKRVEVQRHLLHPFA